MKNPVKIVKYTAFVTSILCSLFAQQSYAWNTSAMYIQTLEISKNGSAWFELVENDYEPGEYRCKSSGSYFTRFVIQSCGDADDQCISAVDRMIDTLAAAKMDWHRVHVGHNNCIVYSVALKPPIPQ